MRAGSAISILASLIAFGGCAAGQRAVPAGETGVAGGRMTVSPSSTWTRLPDGVGETRWEEVWTLGGSQVDRVTFIGGLPDGVALVNQKKHAEQQVPAFHARMLPHDLMSMVEVSYRVNGVASFDFDAVEPVDFLGGPGISLRFDYASGVGIPKKGRWVMRVIDGALYAMKLESVAGPSFEAVATGFDSLVAGARLRPR